MKHGRSVEWSIGRGTICLRSEIELKLNQVEESRVETPLAYYRSCLCLCLRSDRIESYRICLVWFGLATESSGVSLCGMNLKTC